MTREEAKAQGLTRYQGRVCGKGHSGERYVSSDCCCACQLGHMQQYRREGRGIESAPVIEKPLSSVIKSEFITPPSLKQLMGRR